MNFTEDIKELQKATTVFLKTNKTASIPEKEIEKLRDVLRFHEYRYYILNDPLIADYEYDELYKALEKMEKENPSLITSNSMVRCCGGSIRCTC